MAYAVDLFCGAGGMSEGLIQAGFHILFSSDINADVQKTYINRHHQLGYIQGYNTYFHQGDICELTGDFVWQQIRALQIFNEGGLNPPQQIDAIFGGPPCQGFSRAGQRREDDPRNLLFREYLRVISQLNPRYVVMENVEGFNDTKFYGFQGVTGIQYEDEITAPEILINELNIIGYEALPPKVLDASDFGVPQRRKRAIFIAYRQGENAPEYPRPTIMYDERATVRQAIGDMIRDEQLRREENNIPSQYQLGSKAGRTPAINGVTVRHEGDFLNNDISRHLPHIVDRFSLYMEGEDGNALVRRIKSEGIQLNNYPHLLAEYSKLLNMAAENAARRFEAGDVTDEMIEKLLTKKTIRTRLYKDRPSLTIVTLPDDYISPFEDRIFSVREMARLQSFDDSFEFLGKRTTGGKRRRVEIPQYTQVGNAVPPLLAKAVAREILAAMER